MKIQIIPRGTRGRTYGTHRHRIVTISTVANNSRKNKGVKTAVCICIGSDIMKELRWQAKDRLAVTHDPEAKEIILERSNSGVLTFAISAHGGNSDRKKNVHGLVRMSNFPEYRFPDFGKSIAKNHSIGKGLTIYYSENVDPKPDDE